MNFPGNELLVDLRPDQGGNLRVDARWSGEAGPMPYLEFPLEDAGERLWISAHHIRPIAERLLNFALWEVTRDAGAPSRHLYPYPDPRNPPLHTIFKKSSS